MYGDNENVIIYFPNGLSSCPNTCKGC